MTLDQIVSDALEQLPESHVHTLAHHLLMERERAARAEADRDKHQMEASAWRSEVVKLQRIEAAAREAVRTATTAQDDRSAAWKAWHDLEDALQ